MQWKRLPIPKEAQGKPAIHYTTVYKVFAKRAGDGSLWQPFLASVRHLAAEKHLGLRVLHGDGANTVAKKGAMALATGRVVLVVPPAFPSRLVPSIPPKCPG